MLAVIVRTTTQASSQLSSAELFPILRRAKLAEVAQLKFMVVSDKHLKMRFYYDMHERRERLGPSVRVALLTKLSCHRSFLYSSPKPDSIAQWVFVLTTRTPRHRLWSLDILLSPRYTTPLRTLARIMLIFQCTNESKRINTQIRRRGRTCLLTHCGAE
jgi:hypothetical protein